MKAPKNRGRKQSEKPSAFLPAGDTRPEVAAAIEAMKRVRLVRGGAPSYQLPTLTYVRV